MGGKGRKRRIGGRKEGERVSGEGGENGRKKEGRRRVGGMRKKRERY